MITKTSHKKNVGSHRVRQLVLVSVHSDKSFEVMTWFPVFSAFPTYNQQTPYQTTLVTLILSQNTSVQELVIIFFSFSMIQWNKWCYTNTMQEYRYTMTTHYDSKTVCSVYR